MSNSSRHNLAFLGLVAKLGPKLWKLLAPLTKLLKSGKFLKVGLAGASTATYAYLLTWEFALIIMGSLVIHEGGHLLAMERRGMDHKGMYFIPLFGAAAVPEENFQSHYDEAYVAAMGPIFGLATAAVAALIYLITTHPMAAAAASWIALINLFNLLPIKPLDGGRIMSALAFSINDRLGFIFTFGVLIIAAIAGIVLNLGILYIIIPIGALEMFGEYYSSKKGLNSARNLRDQPPEKVYSRFRFAGKKTIPNDNGTPTTFKYNNGQNWFATVTDITPADERPDLDYNEDMIHLSITYGDHDNLVLNESLFWSLIDDEELSRSKPGMSSRGIAGSATTYIGLIIVLLAMMLTMQDVPGAAAAMEALK